MTLLRSTAPGGIAGTQGDHDSGGAPRVFHVGSFPPRACGIATYTRDVATAVQRRTGLRSRVVAVEDTDGAYRYPRLVAGRIVQHDRGTYRHAASVINRSGADVVHLQHEFGLFGGRAGEYVLDFLDALQAPVVTTFHTTLPDPDLDIERVTRAIAARSARVVVLARTGHDILTRRYGVDPARVRVIPHGVPTVPYGAHVQATAKARLGLTGRTVLATFGLLSAGKGIEDVIQALPALIEVDPGVLYCIVGATHPNVRRTDGERYREMLAALAASLGVAGHVRFDDRYLSLAEIVRYLQATDFYVMAYRNPDQIVSGTLAYALGAGRVAIATPFLYAQEVLADGRGVLVPFGRPDRIAAAVAALLQRPAERAAIELRAYQSSRDWQWPSVGARYVRVCTEALGDEHLAATRSLASAHG